VPYFSYRGRNSRGELVTGLLEGGDSGAVADQLLSIGVTPIDVVSAAGPRSQDMPDWLQQFTMQRVELVDLMLFSRQMHTLLKAGVPILRSLAGLQESATNPSLKRLIGELRQSLDAGRELSDAMRRHPKVFDTFYVSLIRVGEMTGLLEDVFMRLYQHLEFEKDMRERIKAALRYPTFVIIAVMLAIALINLFVIPVFAKVFAGFNAPLPLMTRILVGVSDVTVQYWPVMIAAVVGAVVGFRSWVGTRAGKYAWDRYKLRIPIAGKIILKATLARFARSFALSVKSGVPVVQGLTVVSSVVDNDYIGQRIEQMRDGVERGESVLRTAAAAGVFTPIVLQMVAVGDETGELDDMLFEVAEMYEGEVDYEIKTLSAQIEPILLVFLGGLVLILALGVFLPIWELGQVALHPGQK
jgi:MSHA biogenesis protein MshG